MIHTHTYAYTVVLACSIWWRNLHFNGIKSPEHSKEKTKNLKVCTCLCKVSDSLLPYSWHTSGQNLIISFNDPDLAKQLIISGLLGIFLKLGHILETSYELAFYVSLSCKYCKGEKPLVNCKYVSQVYKAFCQECFIQLKNKY